jgi:rSAM/selenodomain-associated transferase 2
MGGSLPVDESRISVVIPALDEEACLARAIRSVSADAEVIVVDGHSRDRTREIARELGAVVLSCPPSRGGQIGLGARRASGEWLLFLHADTWLEPGWAGAVRSLGAKPVGGAFRLAIEAPGRAYRLVEAAVDVRSRFLGLPYGDQALFVRREAYDLLGGMAPFPLMEDVHLVKRLKALGPIAHLPQRAFTNPRRWERHGLVGTSVRNWALLALYAAGVAPSRLARMYGSPGGL